MSDPAILNAQAARDRLAKEINELAQKLELTRRELQHTEEFIKAWEKFYRLDSQVEFSTGSQLLDARMSNISSPPTQSVRRNSKKEFVARVSRELIEEKNRPLSREELFPLLVERGVVIEGSDPPMILSTMLWRTKESAKIVRLKGGGYWLADRPLDEPLYRPEVRVAILAGYGNPVVSPAVGVDSVAPVTTDDNSDEDDMPL